MTRFEEQAVIGKTGSSGGKSFGGGGRSTTFHYFGNFAVGLCEGPIAGIRRIWADGKELDQTGITARVYNGDELQNADPLIVAKEGADNAPAYRGLAYVVFERLPLDPYGNRLPLLSFEVIRPIGPLADKVTAVCVIPGSSEYAYDPRGTLQLLEPGVSRGENRHQFVRESDWTASLDALQSMCPNLQSIALVVSWFGDDLRAGDCSIQPRTELANKTTDGAPWSVAGLNRATALQVSQYDDKPAFGGTPADDAVTRAIQDIKDRGLEAVFYPFVMMDIPHNNTLTDPWSGAVSQPAYPWRGRITCDPAPGQAGSVDATPAAQSQIDALFGSSAPPASEWSMRRFVLHYANVCQEAGGVDVFLIGSELAALTRVRSAPGQYPACDHLAQLAHDVAAILDAETEISYAADWTEYGAHVLDNGDEVRFPLDVVWGQSEVSFVGIDAYWPLSDWRDGDAHLDFALSETIYDRAYLRSRITAGEAYDWYYPDIAAREAQARVEITDGAYGKPWIFRQKDIAAWWSNPHFERVNGVEMAQATAWNPASKPIWMTEIGCPAVDKGANAPNVFPDTKSSENATPYFSSGHRDDLIQQRTLEALLDHYAPDAVTFDAANNPVSPHYGGRMVREDRIHIWAWDARPFPAFPALASVWSDAPAWDKGHWINGRLENASLNELVTSIVQEVPGLEDTPLVAQLENVTDGYVVERPMSPRSAIEPLASFFGFDAIVSSGRIAFLDRGRAPVKSINNEELVSDNDEQPLRLTRAQESELSQSVSVTIYDGSDDYRPVTAQSRRLEGHSRRQTSFDVPIVTDSARARARAEIFLQDMWTGRETGQINLPPSKSDLEVGDVISLPVDGASRLFQLTGIDDTERRSASIRAIDPAQYRYKVSERRLVSNTAPIVIGPAEIKILELVVASSNSPPLQYVAAYADPWTGPLAIWRQNAGGSYEYLAAIQSRARMGTTLAEFGPGPVSRLDNANELLIELAWGALESRDEIAALSGNPAIAVQGEDGAWEIINFATAEMIGPRQYSLCKLVRGVGAAEYLAGRTILPGASVVILDDALAALTNELTDLDTPIIYRIGPARLDYTDASYVQIEAEASNLVLKPYAPAHAHALRKPEGLQISFIRRGRIGSDPWLPGEIPLGEDIERYELDILQGGAVVRTLSGIIPELLYPAGDEIADFGAPQQNLELRIYQMSNVAGRGFPLHTIVAITP